MSVASRVAGGSVIGAALVLSCFQITNLDIGGHLAVGRRIVETGRIPSEDFLSHTAPGHPYVVHQWLGEVILHLVESAGGDVGLVLLRMAVVLGGALLLYRNSRREGAGSVWAWAIVLLLLVAARPRFLVRPMLASFLFLPFLQGLLQDFRHGRSPRLWPILPAIPLWGHVHSGVWFGGLLIGLTLVGEALRTARGAPGARPSRELARLGAVFGLSAALLLATLEILHPAGASALFQPVLLFRDAPLRSLIAEYRPVDLLRDWPFDLVAGALLLGILFRPRRVGITDALVVAAFGALAFQAVRGILPFAAVSAPLLARTWGDLGARRRVAPAAVTAGLALLVSARAAAGWIHPFGFGKDPRHYPDSALDVVDQLGLQGPIFNTDVFASALLWRWRGEVRVFVDARFEAYPREFWGGEYYRVLEAAPGWEGVLDRRGVQWAILRREGGKVDRACGEALWSHPGWTLVHWDDFVLLFVRTESPFPENRAAARDRAFTAFHPRRAEDVAALRGDALAGAAAQLEAVCASAPGSFLPRWCQAAAWTRLGRGREAAALFDELAGQRGARDNAAFSAARAEAELVRGRRDLWRKHLEESGEDPGAPAALFAAAVLLVQVERAEEAQAVYRELLAADPDHTDAMNNLALLLAREVDSRGEALRLAEGAVRRAPADGYYVATRAEVLWRSGRKDSARAEFARARRLIAPVDSAAHAEIDGWLSRGD